MDEMQTYKRMLEREIAITWEIDMACDVIWMDAHEGNWPLGQVVRANGNTLDDRLSNLGMIAADMIAVVEMEIYRGWSKQTDKE
jgi:hypothetical protein